MNDALFNKKKYYEAECARLERLVYDLYGLPADEIKIMEEITRR